MVDLSNAHLKVSIAKEGAELRSLFSQKYACELLWQGAKDIWARHAPILFPIVGKLKEGYYLLNDKKYHLSQHGFARDHRFELLTQTENHVGWGLKANEATLAIYPFLFELHIAYTLIHNEIKIEYTVFNHGREPMPYGIGAHPGFNVPFFENEKIEDYFLHFESETLSQTSLSNGLRKKEKTSLYLPNKRLLLSSTLFNSDALVFEASQIHQVSLASSHHNLSITVKSIDWPYYGIWSKKGDLKFVCLEPWQSITDSEHADSDLFRKEGMRVLAPGASEKMAYSIIINNV
jgi:galactose mutarotase-like enzyme